MKLNHTYALIAFACAFSTGAALAAPAGLGFGDGVSLVTIHSEVDGENLYEINGPDDGFYFDPSAGAWEKQLLAPINGFQPGQIYTVREWFTFFPPPAGTPNFPLEDWHEEISLGATGQVWDVWTTENFDPIISFDPGFIDPVPGLEFMISADGTGLWFDFDPINIGPNGVTLHIEKEFRFTGSTVSFDPVIITQYPTPTPGTLALLGIAGIGASRRRR
jgi:hypothetical protein